SRRCRRTSQRRPEVSCRASRGSCNQPRTSTVSPCTRERLPGSRSRSTPLSANPLPDPLIAPLPILFGQQNLAKEYWQRSLGCLLWSNEYEERSRVRLRPVQGRRDPERTLPAWRGTPLAMEESHAPSDPGSPDR